MTTRTDQDIIDDLKIENHSLRRELAYCEAGRNYMRNMFLLLIGAIIAGWVLVTVSGMNQTQVDDKIQQYERRER